MANFEYYLKSCCDELTQPQLDVLMDIENASLPYSGYKSFGDLRKKRKVAVVIDNKQDFSNTMLQIIGYNKWDCPIDIIGDFNMRKDVEEMMSATRKYCINDNIQLLGLYTGQLLVSSPHPAIYLFQDNIEAYADNHKLPVELVYGFVYVHEMMHAYYDSVNPGYLCIPELEEPFAEYGMLYFLNSCFPGSELMATADNSVRAKQNHGPCEYGFGAYLYDNTRSMNQTWIEKYRFMSQWIPNTTNGLDQYIYGVRKLSANRPAYVADSRNCYKYMEWLLNQDLHGPALPIFSVFGPIIPKINPFSGGSTIRSASVTMQGITSEKSGIDSPWAVSSLMPGSRKQACILHSASLYDIQNAITEILVDRKMELTVADPTSKLSLMLSQLCSIFNGVFTVVFDRNNYWLFGPESALNDFSSKTVKAAKEKYVAPPKANIRVTFSDGSVIQERNATDTMVRVIELVGPNRVRKDYSKKYNGIPLVSNIELVGKQRILSGGLFLFVNRSTPAKAKILQDVSDELGLGWLVEIV